MRTLPLVVLATLSLGALPAAAAPVTPVKEPAVTTIAGAPGPGPAKYNKVFVLKYGPATAKHVLVLVPGTSGGAGDFALVAPEIARRVPGLQVWAMDRREQALEDTAKFRDVLAGKATVQDALDHYLGNILAPRADDYHGLDPAQYGFVADWGMTTAMNDLRRVVLSASARGKRKVILGGHSLGGSFAAAYPAWDFAGRPGYKDLAGIVAIDGGLLGTFDTDSLATVKTRLAAARKQPFLDLLGLGFPWVAGPFAELGSLAVLQDADAPSALQTFPLLPGDFKPPVPATNAGLLGYAFDASTSPSSLSLIQVRAGQLAASGDPRPWQNGEVTPIENVARTFGAEPLNAVDWYFPIRLGIDTNAANQLTMTPQAKFLGLRLMHLKDVNLPYYAFQTSLTGKKNGVVNGAKRYAKLSKVPKGRLVIVDRKATTSHLDPLTAAPETNDFVKTVVPFLKAIK